jgi:hypothetical protein
MKRLLVALLLLVAGNSHAAEVIPRQYQSVRASAILTTSYVGSTAVDARYDDQLHCLINFTIGSLTTAEFKFQYSQDNSNWFDEGIMVGGTTSSDEYISTFRSKVSQLAATSTKTVIVPVLARYVRIAIKGTGTVTSSLAAVGCYSGNL